MNRETYLTLIDSYNELKEQIRLLVFAYKKIYKESSNPKYKKFKDDTYFVKIISFDELGVEVKLENFYDCENFDYRFGFDKISMSKKELENFAKSEIEQYNSEKLAKEWGGWNEFDGSCFE